jgi:hypothetical protein
MKKRLMLLAVALIMSLTGCTGDGTPTPDVWSMVVAPSITSVNKATFTEGTGGTFTVIASGHPDPTFSLSGTLPTGVTFNTTSGILAGTPETGTAGTYPLTFTASNGIFPNATQNFTLTVIEVFSELFVADEGTGNVYVLNRTADGLAGPLRTITGLNMPNNVAVDRVNNELFVMCKGDDTIKVFSRTANGADPPLRTIDGVNSTGDIVGMVVDPVNNELFVANNTTVIVIARDLDGPAAALRTIATGSDKARGVALDTTNNELFVADNTTSEIYVYERTADGIPTPLRTITGVNGVQGLALDLVNNELIAGTTNDYFSVFSRTANGAAAAHELRRVTVAGGYLGVVAVNTINNELLVTDVGRGLIYAFDRTANDADPPLRTITGLDEPRGIDIGP